MAVIRKRLGVRHGLGDMRSSLHQEVGGKLSDLLVFSSAAADPYHLDQPSSHRDAKWLKEMMQRCGLFDTAAPIHFRGIHYAIVSLPASQRLMTKTGKEFNKPYRNTHEHYFWLMTEAGKAARWLGYVPWEKISDERNEAPSIQWHEEPEPDYGIRCDMADIECALEEFSSKPQAFFDGARVMQPYRIVLLSEKLSARAVLAPIADKYNCDLFLPSGKPSDTMLHTMAKAATEDGREMVVLTFTDCDITGYEIPGEVAHKLRAFRDEFFPALKFRVVQVGLTEDQVKELNLPEEPLKDTDKRAPGWRTVHDVEQTEIDALVTLRPDVLTEIAESAIKPYYDDTLHKRVRKAREAYEKRLQAEFEKLDHKDEDDSPNDLDRDYIAELEKAARKARNDFVDELDGLAKAVQRASEIIVEKMPEPELPEPNITPDVARDAPGEYCLTHSELDLGEHINQLRTHYERQVGRTYRGT